MTSLPPWLGPLVDLVGSVDAEQLAPKFPHPPEEARPAGVLMLMHEIDGAPGVLLTERASTLRNHAAQISFPGGRQDPGDADLATTALREAHEEVGLDPAEVEVFGELPPLWLPPSNHAVTTILGHWTTPGVLEPRSPDEVQAVFAVTIDHLMDPANRFSVVHPSGWVGPGFDIGAPVPLWGFTAGIIARLFARAGWEKPWDELRTVDIREFQ